MKYNDNNLPLQCMMTQSTCYRGTRVQDVVGVLWHSTGANNTTIKRYVQPDDKASNRDYLISLIGKNAYNNDWNHIEREAGVSAFIGTLADGSVATVQVLPWNYRNWGCGSGAKGSCNNGWVQFEICEDNLTNKDYFDKVYKEACELTAFLCKKFKLDPMGTASCGTVAKVPVITCHADSYKLGLGSNHGDVLTWFKKFGKTMDDVRADVKKLIDADRSSSSSVNPATPTNQLYRVGTAWENGKCVGQIGAYSIIDNAISACLSNRDTVYKVFDSNGIQVYPTQITESTETDEKIYRVGTDWSAGKCIGQIGAYRSFDNAIAACKAGYKVFDEQGSVVYSVETPIVEEADEIYRVGLGWSDGKCTGQIGAYKSLDNAKSACDKVTKYMVFNSKGKVVYPVNQEEEEAKEVEKNPQPVINPYTQPSTNLKKGDKNEGVKWLQWELVKAGYDIEIDGSFGPATDTAVKDFQKKYNLEVDGIVGTNTRKVLTQTTRIVNPYSEPPYSIDKGTKNDYVKWIQWELVDAGYNLEVDGSFGPTTEAAVRDFQKKNGLDSDGIVGPKTREALKKN